MNPLTAGQEGGRILGEARESNVKFVLILIVMMSFFTSPVDAEMYKWVDEKGTVHFADDLSKIPEKYQSDAELRKTPKETPPPVIRNHTISSSPPKAFESEGFHVNLLRKNELWMAEVTLNDKLRQYFIVDTGASFTLISVQAAKDLGVTIDENTPFIPVATVSGSVLTPLATLRSIRVGEAEAENVEAIVYTMPSGLPGLLGNSFLNKFRVAIDTVNGRMTLLPMRGIPSPDRPGGYTRDFWAGQFRFYHGNLQDLQNLKNRYQSKGDSPELRRVNNAIRFFENQLSELERKASFAGVPRNWRE